MIGDALTTDIGPTSNPESEQAWDLISEHYNVPERERTEVLLVISEEETVDGDNSAFQEYVVDLYNEFLSLDFFVGGTHYYDTSNEAHETLASLDGHTAALVLTINPNSGDDWNQYWDIFKNHDADQWLIPDDPLQNNQSKNKFQIRSFNAEESGTDTIVIKSSDLRVDDDDYRQFVEDLFFDLTALGRNVIWGGIYYYATGAESMVSADGRATIIPININSDDYIGLVLTVIEDARENSDFAINIAGEATVDSDFNELAEHDLQKGELMIGLPAAIFVLILVFGTLAAAAVPLVMAIVTIVIALGLSMLFAQGFDISIFLVNMVFMMGLALGIDYCLFIIARYREERARGLEKYEAIERSGATASRAVLFSGITVFLALIALMLVPHGLFISLGLGAVLVVLVSIVASLTFIPALLGFLGDRVNTLRIPLLYRIQNKYDEQNSSGVWDHISRAVMRFPLLSILLGGGLLIAAAVPILYMDVGTSGISTLPDYLESKKGFIALEQDFSEGLIDPVVIVIDGSIDEPEIEEGINSLKGILAQHEAFGEVSQEITPDGELVKLEVPVSGGDASSEVVISAVNSLRSDYIPDAFEDTQARVLVTGSTAEMIDHINIGNNGLRIIIPFILLLSFILLTLVFRSIVVPIKAVILNLLSVGAAYGLLVLVFQKGIGADLLGFQQVETVEWWVPAFLFAVLFGLSMDYHVFLLSRIRERFFETHDNAGSVAYGIRSTGRLITGAALIMIAVFVGFASGDLVMFQQMGFGLAVAVFLDATIVRSVLVPASMKLLGEKNWYLPSWLRWLPKINAEG